MSEEFEHNGATSDELVASVLDAYEKRPYPAEDERVLSDKGWKLAPLGWWNGVGRLAEGTDGVTKVLVAGCGTGNEAFNVARALPQAQVVGVDFSEKAIQIANRWREASGIENVSFHQTDLTAIDLPEQLSEHGPFDLISCHGVISYIPSADKALSNFNAMLAEDGALYLGCNGPAHISRRYREVLERLGSDLARFPADRAAREKVALCDDLTGIKPGKGIANQSDGYIDSDIYGEINQCLTLERWIEMAEGAGLTFLTSLAGSVALSALKYQSSANLLMERALPDSYVYVDFCRPTSFHRLLFGKNGRQLPRFSDDAIEDLSSWRPLVNLWKRSAIPAMKKPYDQVASFKLNIPGLYKNHSLKARTFVLEFFRLSDGESTVGEICERIGSGVTPERLRPLLFRFTACGMLCLKPPA